jgi:hypothetical protein
MLLSESYKNRLLELAGVELLSEADQKDIIINKIGLSPELADWAIGLNPKLSIWIANQVKKFNLDKTNESDFRDILDWIKGNQGAINIKTYDFESAKKAAKEWHDENFKVNNDLVLKDKKIILQTGPYYWVQLETVEDCIEEGEAMGHCIGDEGHSGPISEGDHLAFSMRNRENKPHITLEIDSEGNIIEFKGKENKVPIPSYMDHAVEFLKEKKDLWNEITDSTFWNGLREIYNDEQFFNFYTINNKKLTDYNVFDLLSGAKDQMANIILKYKGDNLTNSNVYQLFYYAKDKDQMANILGKENINKLTNKNVHDLLYYATDKDQMANIIGKEKINKLTDDNVFNLLHVASDRDQMANIIGKEKINKLTDDNVYKLLLYVTDKDQIKNTLLKYIPKERINDIIQNNEIKTELIPESRSVYNIRKTIQKLIRENYK